MCPPLQLNINPPHPLPRPDRHRRHRVGDVLCAGREPHAGARGEPERALSRPARLLQAAHRQPLRPPAAGGSFPVIPLGMVGADDVGDRLLGEMAEVGLDTALRWPGRRAAHALRPVPDLSRRQRRQRHRERFGLRGGGRGLDRPGRGRVCPVHRPGIALALPEVPLEARQKLLALGTAHGFLRVASFTSAEIVELAGRLDEIDLLALNLDEAAALAGVSAEGSEPGTRCAGGAGQELSPEACGLPVHRTGRQRAGAGVGMGRR